MLETFDRNLQSTCVMFRLIKWLSRGKGDNDTLSTDIPSIKSYNFTNLDVSLITLTVHFLELSLDLLQGQ